MKTADPTALRCKDCGEEKPLEDFYRNHSRGTFESYCKGCKRARSHQRYVADPEAFNHRQRIARRRNIYGITPEQYDEMFAAQDGRCAICRRAETTVTAGKVWDLSVDHDHRCCPGRKSCGQCIRGLLCNDCNRFIGQAGDDIDRLWAAIEYLIAHAAAQSGDQVTEGVS